MCGACCMNLKRLYGIYDKLDRGDGVCKNFDEESKRCLIYNTRPDICRVEWVYTSFKHDLCYEEYLKQTVVACSYLRMLKS